MDALVTTPNATPDVMTTAAIVQRFFEQVLLPDNDKSVELKTTLSQKAVGLLYKANDRSTTSNAPTVIRLFSPDGLKIIAY